MIELIFISIAYIGYKIILRLPGYTPEQVGSTKWIVRRGEIESIKPVQRKIRRDKKENVGIG